ncbi:hypothetical protein [Vibrio fluvialis]|uniref:hypothetical protein n=1 Tax=Vibrio fluvialis TaxID=676 RepID=UPI00192AC6F7|nr:hypothetical protein [Vibrio fluvialis]MBL4260179.1 hypothetical protein [Vibrio fluvialis]
MENFSFELLEKVNSFYSTSFNQLMTLMIGLIAFIGVFVPLLFAYYQNRKSALELEAMEAKIDQKIEQAKLELLGNIEQEISLCLESLSKGNEKKVNSLASGIYHIQANNQLKSGKYKNAGSSIATAISFAVEAEEELNLGRQLNILTKKILPNLTVKEEPNIEGLDNMIDTIVNQISALNENGRYTDAIRDLIKAASKAKERLESEKVA